MLNSHRTKIVIILIIIAAILSAGCTGKSTPEAVHIATPTATPAQTITAAPTVIATPAPTETPTQTSKYDLSPDTKYELVAGTEITAGNVNGRYVSFKGRVFKIGQRQTVPATQIEILPFQVFGNPLSYENPIFIQVPTYKINGTIRNGMIVEIYGYVDSEWITGTNGYGADVSEPFVYAQNTTVIPEITPN